jgi:hypothetical protein
MKNSKGLFIKNPKFWRVPRKLKKKIPKDTHYCYTPTSKSGVMDDGSWGYTIKLCGFYDWLKIKDLKPPYLDEQDLGEETVGYCKLIKCEIDDQCKSCGQRYNKLWN